MSDASIIRELDKEVDGDGDGGQGGSVPKVVTVSQFAQTFFCSQSHVYRLIRDGKVRAAKLGDRLLIPASEVERIIGEAS